MEVVKGQETRWENLADAFMVQYEKITEIKTTYRNDFQRMEAVVDDCVRYFPLCSWGDVARALQDVGLYQPSDVVTAKYIRGI